jgi:hypothetical protein
MDQSRRTRQTIESNKDGTPVIAGAVETSRSWESREGEAEASESAGIAEEDR